MSVEERMVKITKRDTNLVCVHTHDESSKITLIYFWYGGRCIAAVS
jgi:hypothetical protein